MRLATLMVGKAWQNFSGAITHLDIRLKPQDVMHSKKDLSAKPVAKCQASYSHKKMS